MSHEIAVNAAAPAAVASRLVLHLVEYIYMVGEKAR